MQRVLFLLFMPLLLLPPFVHPAESDRLAISLAQSAVFSSPGVEAEAVVLSPGSYLVGYAGNSILEVTDLSTRRSSVIAGTVMEHHETLTAPIAALIADDQSNLHIVLLLANGKGIDAVGMPDEIGSRGISSGVIATSRIRTAINQHHTAASSAALQTTEKSLIVVAKAEEMRPENLLARIQDLERRLEQTEQQLSALAHHTHTYTFGTPGLTTTQGVKMILENNSPSMFAVWQPGVRFGCSACETSWPKFPDNR